MRIELLPNGTYAKIYTAEEIEGIKGLYNEAKDRQAGDNNLLVQINSLGDRVTRIDQGLTDRSIEIETERQERMDADQDLQGQIDNLKSSPAFIPYSKEEIQKMLVPWKVEEIDHLFTMPTNEIFNSTKLNEIRVGYQHFEKGNLNISNSLSFVENTMRRYTIDAYVSTPKQISLSVTHNDDCAIYLRGSVVAQLNGSNFNLTPNAVTLTLTTGWNKIQVLAANGGTEGAIAIGCDLADLVEALNCFDITTGMVDGTQLAVGSIDHDRLNVNDDYQLKSLRITATATSGLWVGNETQGIIRIGDGYISKVAGEMFSITGGFSTSDDTHLLGNTVLGVANSNDNISVNIPWTGDYAPYTKSEIKQLLTDMGLTIPEAWR